jgi:hypothetical protein
MRMTQRVLRNRTLSRRPRLHSRKLPEKGTGAFRGIAEGAGGKGLERHQDALLWLLHDERQLRALRFAANGGRHG